MLIKIFNSYEESNYNFGKPHFSSRICKSTQFIADDNTCRTKGKAVQISGTQVVNLVSYLRDA